MGGIGLRHLDHGIWQREGCLAASRRGSGASRQPQDLPRPGGCCLGPPYQQMGSQSSSPKCLTHSRLKQYWEADGERGTGPPACRVHRGWRNEARIVLWGPFSLGFHPGFALNWLCAPEQGSEIPKVLICHRRVEAIILVLPCYLLPCYQHQD